jgi:general secretion pathway protein I
VRRARCGFTLLEVLIALAIVALALVALVRTAGVGVDALGRERDVTLATWVASDVIADVRLAGGLPPPGKRTGTQRMGEREWFWEAVVQGTEEPALRRVDVRVFEDRQRTAPVASLVGFVGQR